MPCGTLYIVATPIGNLEDITLRALRVLKEVAYIAAEDTRHSLKLLNAYGITKPLISYWSGREKVKAEAIIAKLREGFPVAVISDAGTPGISDPGAVLIKRAIEEGIAVVPVPGPSALIAALSISGLSAEEFTFIGFLPPKTVQRQKKLQSLVHEPRTLVFYEAPHRLSASLQDMEACFGPREAVVIKEMTKLHEEVVRDTLPAILKKLSSGDTILNSEGIKYGVPGTRQGLTPKGEFVVLVEGARKTAMTMEEAMGEIKALMKKGMGRKEAVKTVAGEYGLSRKELYDRSLG